MNLLGEVFWEDTVLKTRLWTTMYKYYDRGEYLAWD